MGNPSLNAELSFPIYRGVSTFFGQSVIRAGKCKAISSINDSLHEEYAKLFFLLKMNSYPSHKGKELKFLSLKCTAFLPCTIL